MGEMSVLAVAQPPPLVVRGLDSLLSLECPKRRPMMGGWLRERHLVLLYAPSGVGKSYLALSVALAVAGGGSIAGLGEAPAPRRVLYVDGEMDMPDLQERSRQLLGQVAVADRGAALANLKFLARMDQKPGTDFPDLVEEEGRRAIIGKALEARADLVILDNLSTLAAMQEENESASFNCILDLLVDLKQRGRSVIVVHHSRKNSMGDGAYRGSQKLSVVFNTIVRLEKPEHAAGRGAAFRLVWEKFRELRDDSTSTALAMRLGEDGWSAEPDEDARVVALLAELKSLRHTSVRSAAETLGIPSSTADRLKHKAIALGLTTKGELGRWIETAKELAAAATAEANPDF